MQSIDKSITIQAPVSAVYEYIRDPAKLAQWMTSLTEVRNVQGEGVGQTYEWTYRMLGVPLKGRTEFLEDVPKERIKTETTGGVTSKWVFSFKSDGDATTVRMQIDYTVPVPVLGKIAEKLIVSRNEREAVTNLANIKEMVEAG